MFSYSPPSDLDVKIGHPILSGYLRAPDFTQNLYPRQSEVNAAVNRMAAAWVTTAVPAGHTARLKQHVLLPSVLITPHLNDLRQGAGETARLMRNGDFRRPPAPVPHK